MDPARPDKTLRQRFGKQPRRKKKPVKKIQLADVLPSDVVASQRIDKIFVPQRTKQIDMLEGDEAEVAAALVQKLNLA